MTFGQSERQSRRAPIQFRYLDQSFELMATVRVSFLLAGKRFHRRLNRSVLSDVPAEATRVNRAGPDHKVIRLRGLSHARQYGTDQAVFLRRERTRASHFPFAFSHAFRAIRLALYS